ncbi:unnamed protein product, partial [Hapterophycus canaliculatus]
MSDGPPPQQIAASDLKEYRSQATQPQNEATSFDKRAVAFQQPRLGGVTIAAVSGGGNDIGRPKDAPPPSPFGSVRQRIHLAHGRAVTKNSDTPKPGKQRLGPRKKKLSTLKKRILLDRLERWKATQQEVWPPISSKDGGCSLCRLPFAPTDSSPSPPAATICGAAMTDKRCRGDELEDANSDRVWVVAIHNLVEEEDVEDVDDHAEIERDLWEMASTFGAVCSVKIPRAKAARETGSGPAAVAARVVFGTSHEAERAQEGFHGRVVGGKTLEVQVHANVGLLWLVVIENLISEEDDLNDDDEYDEVFDDVSEMMGVYGRIIDVRIPRIGRTEGNDGDPDGYGNGDERRIAAGTREMDSRAVVVTFGSLAEAKACVQGTKGRRVGGKGLDARLVAGPPRVTHLGPAREAEEEKSVVEIGDGALEGAEAMETEPAPTSMEARRSPSRSTGTPAATAARSRKWRVIIRNLIDADDLQDDDDYAEVCSDTTTLASAYGVVSGLFIPRERETASVDAGDAGSGAQAGEAVAEFQSLGEAEACARGLKGRKVGGQVLDAEVMAPPRAPRKRG